jgi:hypothetical protein
MLEICRYLPLLNGLAGVDAGFKGAIYDIERRRRRRRRRPRQELLQCFLNIDGRVLTCQRKDKMS